MATQSSTYAVDVLYTVAAIICQTLFYGIYAALIPFSTHIMLKKGLKTRLRVFLFSMTIFMFVLSTAYWALSVEFMVQHIKTRFAKATRSENVSNPSCDEGCYHAVWSAFILYILTDGVVVWRAWVICGLESQRMILLSGFFLGCSTLLILATIGIRIVLMHRSILGQFPPAHSLLDRAINITQVGNLIFSLSTNIVATSAVGLKAWRHRRCIREGLRRSRNRDSSTKGERILLLLIESGFLYCVSGIAVLISSLIRLPVGTLGDIYTPMHVQIAGIYPTIVLLLVNQHQTLNETALSEYWGNTTISRTQEGEVSLKIQAPVNNTSRRDIASVGRGPMRIGTLKFAPNSPENSQVDGDRDMGDEAYSHSWQFPRFDPDNAEKQLGGSPTRLSDRGGQETESMVVEVERGKS